LRFGIHDPKRNELNLNPVPNVYFGKGNKKFKEHCYKRGRNIQEIEGKEANFFRKLTCSDYFGLNVLMLRKLLVKSKT
jgi:hypothetical protein